MSFRPKYGSKDREKFEKQQDQALSKACNKEEVAPKPKHIRSAVITTWTHFGGQIFWDSLRKLPLGTHQVMCWKALITVHSLLHDGHPNVIVDSDQRKGELSGLAQIWQQRRSEYALLISGYIDFINYKIQFHLNNPEQAGNLDFDEYLKTKAASDNETGYHLVTAIFGMQDAIDKFQKIIFSMVNSNLTTSQLECRTSALVPLINESGDLYRIVVDILIRLHRCMNPANLAAHREEFNRQFYMLKRFYFDSSNLKYVSSLTRVPQLPDNPPDFLQMGGVQQPPNLPPRPKETNTFPQIFDENFAALPDQVQFKDDTEAEKDRLIAELYRIIEELKQALEALKIQHMEDYATIEMLKQRLRDLYGELERSKSDEGSLAQKEAEIRDLQEKLQKASTAEDKHAKMFKMYSDLRDKHLALLKQSAGGDAKSKQEVEELRMEFEHSNLAAQEKIQFLETEKAKFQAMALDLKKAQDMKSNEEGVELAKYRSEFENLKKALDAQKKVFEGKLKKELEAQEAAKLEAQKLEEEKLNAKRDMINQAVDEAKKMISESITELNSKGFAGNMNASAENVLDATGHTQGHNKKMTTDFISFFNNSGGALSFQTLGNTTLLAAAVQDLFSGGKGITRLTDEEKVEQDIISALNKIGKGALDHLEKVKCSPGDDMAKKGMSISKSSAKLKMALDGFSKLTDDLIPKQVPDQDQLGNVLENEMEAAAQAIADAAKQIQELMEKSRRENTGVKLDVNESILGASSGLMKCIQVLIEKATDSQKEVVAKGKGSASATEFYKKNSRWTEGLISAAQAVGWGAGVLVETADGFVSGTKKVEELIVASREIAASTAQLVAAARVKADRFSKTQEHLETAAGAVTDATKALVRVAKEGAELVEPKDDVKLDNLSHIQAKRKEMEMSTKVLELETKLAKERQKLLSFRKANYHEQDTD
eukprot:Nk52_evm18s218 gene=Nk52_evmTU18s218